MKATGVLMGIIFAATLCHSSNTGRNGTPADRRYGFALGYAASGHVWGNPTHGAQLGVERYVATTPDFAILGSAVLHAGYRPSHQFFLLFNPRFGYRYTAGCGFMAEQHIGIGYLPTRYLYDIFRVNDNGEIVNYKRAWMSSLAGNIIVGSGYDLSRVFSLPVTVWLRSEAGVKYPPNLPMFTFFYSIGAGIVYAPTFPVGSR